MRFTRRLGFESLESRRLLTAVDIPDNLTGKVLDQVATPLNIDNAAGIRAAEIRVAYDTTILNIGEADIVPGSVWASDPTVDLVTSVDDAAGTILVSIFGANSLPAIGGSLVEFRFTIQAGSAVGSAAVIDLTQVRINEGAITLDTTPQPGADATDGRITVVGDDPGNPGDVAMLSGTVYADVNNNSQPDSAEGLPGVRVTLINTATNAQVQTTTQSNGRYEFTNIAPGSYRIQERQPAAYLDGGPNEISVTLIGGQNLTGQDFRELGLRPEFVYNRLHSTLVMPIGSPNWVAAITRINTDAGNAVVNAQIVAPPTNLPQAEGEATAALAARFASPPAVVTPILVAEGEAPVAAMTARSVRLTANEGAISVAASPPGSTSWVVGSVTAEQADNTFTPVMTTLATPSLVESRSTDNMKVLASQPNATWRDQVWSEAIVTPLEFLGAERTAKADAETQLDELEDELLAVDEAFAATDSWQHAAD